MRIQLLWNIDPVSVRWQERFLFLKHRKTGAWITTRFTKISTWHLRILRREKSLIFFQNMVQHLTPTIEQKMASTWPYGYSIMKDKTGLVLRNLDSGDERWLVIRSARTIKSPIAPQGFLPCNGFSHSSKNVLLSNGWKNMGVFPVQAGVRCHWKIPSSKMWNWHGGGPRLLFLSMRIKDTTAKLALNSWTARNHLPMVKS